MSIYKMTQRPRKATTDELVRARNLITCHPEIDGDQLSADREAIIRGIAIKTPVTCGDYMLVSTDSVLVAIGDDDQVYLNSGGARYPIVRDAIRDVMPPGWSITDDWFVTTPNGTSFPFVDNMMFKDGKLAETDYGVTQDTVDAIANMRAIAPGMVSYYTNYLCDRVGTSLTIREFIREERNIVSAWPSDMSMSPSEVVNRMRSLTIDSNLLFHVMEELGENEGATWSGPKQKRVRSILKDALNAALKLPVEI